MSFITDKQTLDDLNILGKFKAHSMFSLFNQTQTTGGERLLDTMFRHPLTGVEEINQRSGLFGYFQDKALVFPFSKSLFQVVENYLGLAAIGNQLITAAGVFRKKLLKTAVRDEQYDHMHNGLVATIEMLNILADFFKQLEKGAPSPYLAQFDTIKKIMADHRLQWLPEVRNVQQLSAMQVARYHHLLLHVFRKEMDVILQGIYQLDVCIAVSDVARARGFAYAKALPQEKNLFHTVALSHPGLEKAVANPLTFNKDQNLLFLTGANMAGKSTFMKAFGIAVYMAHMGFPVAAKEMSFSVREGLYTSINVPDDLNMGYSHFYAEVLRVKHVAEEVARSRDLVVIFDELFKGTNVKDAYDATLSVTEAFSEYRNCFFIISTHIIEVGDALKHQGEHIRFGYLPTVMEGTVPRYTYQMKEGITNDRQGMMIIENEGIVDMLQHTAV
jgi:DNA mismatch repair ATPase MutS